MDEEAKPELVSIIAGLPTDSRQYIANLAEDQVIRLHHGLGTYIRNQYRHGRFRALFRWAGTQMPAEEKHLDSLSWPILLEVWKQVSASSNDEPS